MAQRLTHTAHVNDKGRTIITVGDYRLLLVPRARNGNLRDTWAKTRLYGAVDVLGGELNEKLTVNCARHVSETGNDDFRTQDERDAHMREYRALRRQLNRHVKTQFTDIIERHIQPGHQLDGLTAEKMKFSINAGCTMCSCSPGFILSMCVTHGRTPVDIWLKLNDRD